MNIRNLIAAAALLGAFTLPAMAQVVIKDRVIPDNELPHVQAQCDTLKAREWGNSNIENDPDPNEDIVPRGNAERVRSINLYTLTYQECRRAGLI